jgi:alkanesulfonate monooxygenase SsuD/methylene tetrahydromethanopterin reductase-like flavin-dependent oxidoreductase (luciferase family)
MAEPRQFKIGARAVSIHTGSWRYPGAFPDATFNFAHMKRFVQTMERGKLDAFFLADHLAVAQMPMAALCRHHGASIFEPMTLMSALAGLTDHIGLIATASTSFEEPFHVARRFASLGPVEIHRELITAEAM